MPYALKGKTVVKADTGNVVGHSMNVEEAKKYLRTLRAIEHNPKFAAKLHNKKMG